MEHLLRHTRDLPGFFPGLGLIVISLIASSSLLVHADPILLSCSTRNSSTLARAVRTTSNSTGKHDTNASGLAAFLKTLTSE